MSENTPPGFETFWTAYPHKVGKRVAAKAYAAAIKRGATLEALLRGLETYKRTKRSYADWCHPSTFLNQDRYLDEPAPEMTRERNRTTTPNWDDEFGRFFGERARPDTRHADRGGQSVDLFSLDRPRTLHG